MVPRYAIVVHLRVRHIPVLYQNG